MGISNGVMSTAFYITMAVMFSVSHSVLSVATAHALFYFRNLHAAQTSVAFGHPLFIGVLLANTCLMIILLKSLGIFLPPSLPPRGLQEMYGWPTCPPSPFTAFAAISFAIDCGRLVTMIQRSRTPQSSRKQSLLPSGESPASKSRTTIQPLLGRAGSSSLVSH